MSNNSHTETHQFQPLFGKNDRDTMMKVSGVLAFIARSLDTPLSDGMTYSLDRYSESELQGLIAICHVLSNTLAYAPPSTDT